MEKPFSQACENNKRPILEVLKRHFAGVRDVLEIGSGTGQHAVHFATALPGIVWQPSEVSEAMPALRKRIFNEGPSNLRAPIANGPVNQPCPDRVHALDA